MVMAKSEAQRSKGFIARNARGAGREISNNHNKGRGKEGECM